ncbi:MAG: hypothetical protein INR62_01365 [Rhodospirillales bacterium]|nr:hypothetical protein [Acetobacter sp.]
MQDEASRRYRPIEYPPIGTATALADGSWHNNGDLGAGTTDEASNIQRLGITPPGRQITTSSLLAYLMGNSGMPFGPAPNSRVAIF